MRRSHAERPALITSASESADLEFERRRKRYAIMMATRVVCVIAAALVYRESLLLALLLVVGGAALPWCAVLIANDRPPLKRATLPARTPNNSEQALPGPGEHDDPLPGPHRTIDG